MHLTSVPLLLKFDYLIKYLSYKIISLMLVNCSKLFARTCVLVIYDPLIYNLFLKKKYLNNKVNEISDLF